MAQILPFDISCSLQILQESFERASYISAFAIKGRGIQTLRAPNGVQLQCQLIAMPTDCNANQLQCRLIAMPTDCNADRSCQFPMGGGGQAYLGIFPNFLRFFYDGFPHRMSIVLQISPQQKLRSF